MANELMGAALPATCWMAQCAWPPSQDWVLASAPFETKAQADVALTMVKQRASTLWPQYRVHEQKPLPGWRVFAAAQCPCMGDKPFLECHGSPTFRFGLP